jgi:hypothetical protein
LEIYKLAKSFKVYSSFFISGPRFEYTPDLEMQPAVTTNGDPTSSGPDYQNGVVRFDETPVVVPLENESKEEFQDVILSGPQVKPRRWASGNQGVGPQVTKALGLR